MSLLPPLSNNRPSGALINATQGFPRKSSILVTIFPSASSCYPPHSLTSSPTCLTCCEMIKKNKWRLRTRCLCAKSTSGAISLIYSGLISFTISTGAFGGVDEIYYIPESTGLQSTDFNVMLQDVFIAWKMYLLQWRTVGKFNIYCSSSVCIPFMSSLVSPMHCLLSLGWLGQISSKIKSSVKCREWLTTYDLAVPRMSRKVNTLIVTSLCLRICLKVHFYAIFTPFFKNLFPWRKVLDSNHLF